MQTYAAAAYVYSRGKEMKSLEEIKREAQVVYQSFNAEDRRVDDWEAKAK
jgi:hypothetical protein